jgi:hypothetical protein
MNLIAFLGLRGTIAAALGGISVLVLSILLVIQKGETHHWTKQSNQFEKLYHDEQGAFTQTVANYQAALTQARAEDKANAARVIAEQQATNIRTSQSYEARIATLDAELGRLQRNHPATPANPGSPGNAPVSSPVAPAGGTDGAPGQDGLSTSDAYIASKQAIQLDELIKWVKANLQIDRTGTGSSPSSPTGNH